MEIREVTENKKQYLSNLVSKNVKRFVFVRLPQNFTVATYPFFSKFFAPLSQKKVAYLITN